MRIHDAVEALVCLWLVGVSSTAAAECGDPCGTSVPPGLVVGETWTAAGSPYCVTGDIQVSLLTIEPGVCVRVEGPYMIEVLSTITAVGTEASPISFDAVDPEVPWKGIRFQSTPPGSVLEHCRIEHSDASGITIVDSDVEVRHCHVAHCSETNAGGGIHVDVDGNDVTLVGVTVRDCSGWGGIRVVGSGGNVSLVECIVRDIESLQPGGGVSVIRQSGDLTLMDCVICGNMTINNSSRGGGLYADLGGGHVTVERCIVNDNGASVHGGGMYVEIVEGFALTVRECEIRGNETNVLNIPGSYEGGGIYLSGGGDLVVESSLIADNVSLASWSGCGSPQAKGGGIYKTHVGNATLRNTVICGNAARSMTNSGCQTGTGMGGGMYFIGADAELLMTNCIVCCNTALGEGFGANLADGAGIMIWNGTAVLENCTVTRNGTAASTDTVGLFNNGADVTLLNSILFFNNQITEQPDTYGDQIDGAGTVTATYCDIQNGYPGAGNIEFNPVFAGSGCGVGDAVLILGSPCIDGGDPDGLHDDACFPPSMGTARNDMGAYGGPGACDWTCQVFLPADVMGDGEVDVQDLVAIVLAWGPCEGRCPEDVNHDFTVDVSDLVEVILLWGSTCFG